MKREHTPDSETGIAISAIDQDGIDILFGFDGSEESRGALVSAIVLFGRHLGELTIATVLEFEASKAARAAAQEELADVALLAAGLLDRRPGTITLVGRPDDALVRRAREQAVKLLVIAPRGRGATRAFFGSVASRLARSTDVPVAIMPPAKRRTPHPSRDQGGVRE
jgi:nucleotide-binding universal stress UspA family protein